MDEPQWIAGESALRIHDEQLHIHGGLAGVRDAGLFASALHDRSMCGPTRGTLPIWPLAAAYAAGIARNHPFFDGNKRTAAVICETFLELNGVSLVAGDAEWYQTMITLASGELSEEQLAAWLRANLTPG